jgi:hypothetical protein
LLLGGFLAGGVLAEAALRLLAPALGLGLRSFVREEAAAWAASSARIAGATRLLLRESQFREPVDVVAIGDSMVFGTLVSEDAVFTSRLARQRGLRILNLGVASAGPCVYERMLRLALARLPRPPRLVLYTVFANDFSEPPCGELRDEDLFLWEAEAEARPSFRLRRLRERLFRHSVLYQLLKRVAGFGSLNAGPRYAALPFDDGVRAFLFAPPEWWRPQIELVEGGPAFERVVEQLAHADAMARAAGSKLVLVLMPFKEQVHLRELVAAGALPARSYHASYDALYDRLAQRATRLGVGQVDLREPLRAAARRGDKLYWTLDGHLTPQGHATVAAALASPLDTALGD